MELRRWLSSSEHWLFFQRLYQTTFLFVPQYLLLLYRPPSSSARVPLHTIVSFLTYYLYLTLPLSPLSHLYTFLVSVVTSCCVVTSEDVKCR